MNKFFLIGVAVLLCNGMLSALVQSINPCDLVEEKEPSAYGKALKDRLEQGVAGQSQMTEFLNQQLSKCCDRYTNRDERNKCRIAAGFPVAGLP